MLDVQKELFRYAQGKGAHALISLEHVVLLEVGWCDVLTIRYLIVACHYPILQQTSHHASLLFDTIILDMTAILEGLAWNRMNTTRSSAISQRRSRSRTPSTMTSGPACRNRSEERRV